MGRVEILTGVERRRDWTDEEKLRDLDEVAQAVQASPSRPSARHSSAADLHLAQKLRGYTAVGMQASVTLLARRSDRCRTRSGGRDRTAPAEKAAPKRSAKLSRIEIGCKGGRVLKVDAEYCILYLMKALIRSVEEA